MITLTYEGVEYHYVGFRNVKRGEHFIDNHGEIHKYMGISNDILSTVVKPVPIEHTFSGIVFVEADYRRVEPNEWYLHKDFEGELRRSHDTTVHEYRILVPVRITNQLDASD